MANSTTLGNLFICDEKYNTKFILLFHWSLVRVQTAMVILLILLKYKIISWIGGLSIQQCDSRDFIGLDANAMKYPKSSFTNFK
jgi:hypothetical protein